MPLLLLPLLLPLLLSLLPAGAIRVALAARGPVHPRFAPLSAHLNAVAAELKASAAGTSLPFFAHSLTSSRIHCLALFIHCLTSLPDRSSCTAFPLRFTAVGEMDGADGAAEELMAGLVAAPRVFVGGAGAWAGAPIWNTSCCCHPLNDAPNLLSWTTQAGPASQCAASPCG